jgi:hypothetical protein
MIYYVATLVAVLMASGLIGFAISASMGQL